MDTLFLLVIYGILISCLFGVMDKVKQKYESTWFSTIKKPAWLVKWLNPHDMSLFRVKSLVLAYLFRYPLAALADFWHLLKGILLQIIWLAVWTGYHECTIWVWLIVCNCGYMLFFELFNVAMFNNKNYKP
jgi:hypothetical protein